MRLLQLGGASSSSSSSPPTAASSPSSAAVSGFDSSSSSSLPESSSTALPLPSSASPSSSSFPLASSSESSASSSSSTPSSAASSSSSSSSSSSFISLGSSVASSSSSSSSSLSSLPSSSGDRIEVNQLNVTLGLLQVESGDNAVLAASSLTSRVLDIMEDWLSDPSNVSTILQPANYSLPFMFSSVLLTVLTADCGCSPSTAVLSTIALLNGSTAAVGLLGPTCSVGALTSSLIASYYSIPEISYTATAVSLTSASFPFFFRVVTDDTYRLSVAVAICQFYGWRHVAVLSTSDSYGVGALQELRSQAAIAGISIVNTQSFASGSDGSLEAEMTEMKDSGANIFILWPSTVADCRWALQRAVNYSLVGFDPLRVSSTQYVWIVPPFCSDNLTDDTLAVQQAFIGVLSFIDTVPGGPLYDELVAEYSARWNDTGLSAVSDLSYTALCAFDSVLAYMFGFSLLLQQGILPSPSSGAVLSAVLMSNVSFYGVTGPVSFSSPANDVGSTFNIINFPWPVGSPVATVGNATVIGYEMGVPIARYRNNSQTVFWQDGPGAAPADTYVAPADATPDDDSSSSSVGGVSQNAFITIMSTIGGFICLMLLAWAALWSWRRRMKRQEDELNEARRVATEAKDAAVTSNKAKSQFLANMSHEIRTPMNGVLGLASLLASTSLTAEQQEYVNAIMVSTDSLLSVISDILDYSKSEAGKLELEQAALRLTDVVERAVDAVYRSPQHDELDVCLFLDPLVPDDMEGDATRIRQIIANLLSNALKFSQKVKKEEEGRGGEEEDDDGSGRTVLVIAQPYCGRLHCYPLVDFPPVDGVFVADTRGEWSGSRLKGSGVNVSEGGAVPTPIMRQLKGRKASKAERDSLKAEQKRRVRERLQQRRQEELEKHEERRREKAERSKKSRSDARSASGHSDGPSANNTTPELALRQINVNVEEKAAAATTAAEAVKAEDSSKPPSLHSHSVSSSPSSSRSGLMLTTGGAPSISPLGAPAPSPFSAAASHSSPFFQSSPQYAAALLQAMAPSTFVLQLAVEDAAIGISADMMPRLFKAFTQADASVTRVYQGSGLGLAISAKLAQLMGGGIGCISKVGVGSRFTAVLQTTLPATEEAAVAKAVPSPVAAASAAFKTRGEDGRNRTGLTHAGGQQQQQQQQQQHVLSGSVPILAPSGGRGSAVRTRETLQVEAEMLKRRWPGRSFLSAGHKGKQETPKQSRPADARDRLRMRMQQRRGISEAISLPVTSSSPLTLQSYYGMSTVPPHPPLLPFTLSVLVCWDNEQALHCLVSSLVAYGCEVFACKTREDSVNFMRRVLQAADTAQAAAGSGHAGQPGEDRRRHRRYISDTEALTAPLWIDLVLVNQSWRRGDEQAEEIVDDDDEKAAERDRDRDATADDPASPNSCITRANGSPSSALTAASTGYDVCVAIHKLHQLHRQPQPSSRASHSVSLSHSSPQLPMRQLVLHPSNDEAAVDRKSTNVSRSEQSSGSSSGGGALNLVLLATATESAALDARLASPLPQSSAPSSPSASLSPILRSRLLKPLLPSRLIALLRSVNESPAAQVSQSQSSVSQSPMGSELLLPAAASSAADDSSPAPLLSLPVTVTAAASASALPSASPSASPLPAAVSQPSTLASRYPLRLLLAEDNPVSTRLFLRLLDKLGYGGVVSVSNGLQLLAALRLHCYDVIFCDQQMPEMSGIDAAYHVYYDWNELPTVSQSSDSLLPDMGGLARIHSESVPALPVLRSELLPLYPVHAVSRRPVRPRIIAVSANSDRRDVDNWRGMADDFVSKPISAEVLKGCLLRWGRWLQRQRTGQPEPAAAAD